MEFIISFLEGVITFISPCLLPMLPVYILYFTGGEVRNSRKTLVNALCFVLGFTIVFTAMGAFAASIGSLLMQYRTVVNIITGIIVIIFGLNYMGVFKLPFLNGLRRFETGVKPLGFVSCALFGMIFAVGWTPCVGAFLGSALMLAAQQGSVAKGIVMLLIYSLGLGIPFIISALLIDRLKTAFNFVKKHYKTVNMICGALLVVVGLLMMTGYMNIIISLLSF